MKKLFVLFFLLFSLIGILQTKAEYFDIENYDINLIVDKNKNISIEENIAVYFKSPRHGIFRTIPTKNHVLREDGTSETIKSTISNVRINDNYTTTYNSSSIEYKIGDADRYVSGRKDYNIKYNYTISQSKTLKGEDEFYFNIIGTDWNVDIKKVHFKVILPKKFDTSNIGFSLGERGVSGYDTNSLKYSTYGNTIEGEVLTKLNHHEGLTLRVELPEGYFEYIKFTDTLAFKIYLAILLGLTFATFMLWLIIGKDEQIIPVISFEPPSNMNSALLGTYFREKADDKDITSLIIYLASKGYIEIENKPEDNDIPPLARKILKNTIGYDTTSASNYVIKKLKDCEKTNAFEYSLMQALFPRGEKEVTCYDLMHSEKYYHICLTIKKELNRLCKKLYNEESVGISANFVPVMSVIFSFFILLHSILGYSSSLLFSSNIFLVFCIILSITIFICNFKSNPIFITIWCIGFAGGPSIFLYENLGGFNFDILSVASLICLIVNIICLKNMPKKSKTALRVLGKIAGFKKFLETAEKHRIELLVKDNPSYCFDILPYAYVLGVSDAFISKFEKYLKSDYWKGDITISSFRDFSDACHSTTQPSVSNGGISRSSGGGGGGGCSGGGCGGGGGGSW